MGISDDIAPQKKPAPPQKDTVEKTPLEKGEVEVEIHKGDHDPVIEDIAHQSFINKNDQQNIEKKGSEIDDFFSSPSSKNPPAAPTKPAATNPIPPKPKKKRGCAIFTSVILILILIGIITWQNRSSIKSFLGFDIPTTNTEQSSYQDISQDSAFNDSIKDTESADSTSNSADSSDQTTPESASFETDSKTVVINPTGSTSTAESATETTDQTAETADSTSETTSSSTPSTSLLIKVLNGNGISGSAATIKTTLEAAGYKVSYVGNALTFTYQKTTIYYKTGKSAEATAIAAVLSAYQTVSYLNDAVVGTYDIVVVAGKN